jgi:hypothetical protein
MTLPAIHDLADSMIRIHGITRAVKLADSYAADCAAKADARGYDKWSAVAASLADLIEASRHYLAPER